MKIVITILLLGVLVVLLLSIKIKRVDEETEQSEVLNVEEQDDDKDFPITKEDYKKAFQESGLSSKWSFFEKHLKPEIWIQPSQVEENEIKIGQSKIGGRPDLPTNMDWPKEENGKYFIFLAQINFEEVSNPEIDQLPEKGIIYFFYSEGYTGGKTIFVEDLSSLERKEAPKAPHAISLSSSSRFNSKLTEGIFKPCRLEFKNTYGLPDWQYEFVAEQLNEREEIAYSELPDYSNYTTKLFGHSNCAQYPMEYECEKVSRGYVWPNDKVTDEEIEKEMKEKQFQWEMLFQIDSEEAPKMMWGDVGRLYFWIKKEDLKAKNFDNVIVLMQGG